MANLWLALVITSVVFGYAGNLYAKQTGRDPIKWTVIGIVFNVGILALMLFVGKRSQKAKQFTC